MRPGQRIWLATSCLRDEAGWDYPRYAPPTKEETLQALKSEADWLKGQMESISARIEELEK